MAARKRDTGKKARADKPAKKAGAAKGAKKARKAEVAVVDEDGVEVVEGAMTFEDAILVGTGVALLIAVVLVAMLTGDMYPNELPGTYEEWRVGADK